MVRLTKITTKHGDKGKTMLGDGNFVAKSHPRINAYGTIDEAGAVIGVAIGFIHDNTPDNNRPVVDLLRTMQQHLFNLGSMLCRPYDETKPFKTPITEENIHFLEKHIEDYNQSLSPLESFILSGGTQASAHLHLARTIIRRAERETNLLSLSEYVPETICIYLNRISDLLFILARIMNDKGNNDILWRP